MIEFTFISRKMRKLKFHEKKLLKKVDFFNWEIDNNQHELKIMRKYRILKREQYTMYNKLSRFYKYNWKTLKRFQSVVLYRANIKIQRNSKANSSDP